MRRAKRQTLRRGNLDRGARRGVRRLLARVTARNVPDQQESVRRQYRRTMIRGRRCPS